MKTFLEYVVEDILSKWGDDLSRTVVVFPNKRASLFFNNHLARMVKKPIWSPAYTTISDLFRRHSKLQVADNLKLVAELYKCYIRETGFNETLDHFFGWGQMMIADFDDIDKNMADAEKVFANVHAHHEFDDTSHVTPGQVEAINKFFADFALDEHSQLRKNFIKLWSKLYDIYKSFNAAIARQGLAYEGALYKSVVNDETISFDHDRYIFVGFNVVQKVEQRLFDILQEQDKAFFYWDFDYYYLKGNAGKPSEASRFISEYTKRYRNELAPDAENIYNNFRKPKRIEFVSAKTENIQAQFIAPWLDSVKHDANFGADPDTVVVLCNEGILQTVVHCIPDDIAEVNVTSGYPLHVSPYAAELYALLKSAKTPEGYIAKGKRHIEKATAELTAGHSNPLPGECLFRLYTILQRFEGLIVNGDLDVKVEILDRLFRQVVRSTSVPFSGEPAVGLQVMGVLETRNLDFRNLLILSCNEGNMPKSVNDTSFIPYSIRKFYGLTTIDHKVAVYAYYFYRLLQRAENITIVYNSSTDEGGKGEMSRFMLQMMVECGHKINFRTLRGGDAVNADETAGREQNDEDYDAAAAPEVSIKQVEKTPKVMARLLDKFALKGSTPLDKPLLTPTAINKYMRCQMQFYYNYILGIKEQDDEEMAIDSRVFGILFHAAAQYLYEPYVGEGRMITEGIVKSILNSPPKIEEAIARAFRENLTDAMMKTGLSLIIHDVLVVYLKNLLKSDLQLTPFSIVGLEINVRKELLLGSVSLEDAQVAGIDYPVKTTLGGVVDRLDRVVYKGKERLRVVDYKTGSRMLEPFAGVDAIFDEANILKHSDYYLQTFVYGTILSHDNPYNPNGLMPVTPALFYIQHAAKDDYDPTLAFGDEKILSVADHKQSFLPQLKNVIDNIFSDDVPFTPTANEEICSMCPYAALCRR